MCIYLRHRSNCICVVGVHVCIHKNKLNINYKSNIFLVFALMYNMFNYIHVLILFFVLSPCAVVLLYPVFSPLSLSTFLFLNLLAAGSVSCSSAPTRTPSHSCHHTASSSWDAPTGMPYSNLT